MVNLICWVCLAKQCHKSWSPPEYGLRGGGGLLPLCISLIFSSWLLSDLSCESSFSKSPPGGRYQLATKCEVLFANTFTQIDSESFSSSVMGICEISLWISNITPPPSRVLSFLYTLYGQDSGNNSEVDMELSIFVSWIATIWGWWKSRKANNSSFLPLILLMFMLTNFNPVINLFLSEPVWEAFVPLPFANGSNLFSFSKFNWSAKNESEKLKKSHFGQIQVQFVFSTESYSDSVISEHLLWIHISNLSHWTALWPYRTAPLHRPQSALQLVQYQDPFPDSNSSNSFSSRLMHDVWKRFSHSSHLTDFSDALHYKQRRHWDLGPGFISISPAKMMRMSKFVPFDGLKLRNPSELLHLPSFLVHAKLWAIPLAEPSKPILQLWLGSRVVTELVHFHTQRPNTNIRANL